MNKILKWVGILTISALLIQFTPQVLHAQTAKSILDRASAKLKNAKTIKADIKLTMKNRNGEVDRNGTQSGTFSMKGDAYRIDFDNTQIITDGETIWTYLVPNKEVQIANYVASEQAISPSVLFSGAYDKDFTYTGRTTRKINNKEVHIIKLTPKGRQSFASVDIYIDKSFDIVGGVLNLSNGSTVEYTIPKIQYNPTVSDASFKFDTQNNTGVEVIDLR